MVVLFQFNGGLLISVVGSKIENNIYIYIYICIHTQKLHHK